MSKRKTPQFVNVYLVDQAYGGCEEGGWYYTVGEPVSSVGPLFSQCNIETLRQRREAECREENAGKPSMYSVCSQGEYRVYVENHPAETFPRYVPHYE